MEVDMKRGDSYNEEFKRDAVNLSEEHGVKTAAEKLGVSASCLYSWRRIYLDIKSPTSGETRSYAELLKENRALKKEVSILNNVASTLRKTAAILSQSHLAGMK